MPPDTQTLTKIKASWSTEKKRKDSVANGSLKTITQNVLLDEANETIVSYAVGHRLGSKMLVELFYLRTSKCCIYRSNY
jgi:hypothetical protein